MTRKKLTEVVIHRLDQHIKVRVLAGSPAEAAELLEPFVREDTFFAGTVTSRTHAVEAMLQDRIIQSRAIMERAALAYQKDVEAAQRFAAAATTDPETPV